MTPEQTKALLDRFPFLYREYYLPKDKTCMCWGFCVGKGWFQVIWDLSLAIEKELELKPNSEFAVVQVKEKFGGLRYYIENSSPAIENLIVEAEKLCNITCSECGSPKGKKVTEGFYRYTLCDNCEVKT